MWACKGIDILLNAMSTIDKLDYEMIVIGRNISAQYYKYLLKLKKKLNLDSKIEFKEEMTREKLYAYYRDCDYFVLPSISEGFGIVLIEALAQGKPVVSTRSGGPEDIINEKKRTHHEPRRCGNHWLILSSKCILILKITTKKSSQKIFALGFHLKIFAIVF